MVRVNIRTSTTNGRIETYLAGRTFFTLLIHNHGLHIRHKPAHGALILPPLIHKLHGSSRACLGQSIALLDTNLESFPYVDHQVATKRRSSRVDPAQGREVVLVDNRVLSQREYNGRRHVHKGNAMVLDQLAGLLEVELGHHDATGSGFDCVIHGNCEALGKEKELGFWWLFEEGASLEHT